MSLRHSLPKSSCYENGSSNWEMHVDDVKEMEVELSCRSEVKGLIRGVRKLKSHRTSFMKNSFRFQLEEDVKWLQGLLHEEIELHAILENAFEHPAVRSSDLSCLPNDAQELLSNIATLEMTVSRLEQEITCLHFQLIQERNERRLAECRLRQLPSHQQFVESLEKMQTLETITGTDNKNIHSEPSQHEVVLRIRKHAPVNGLYNHPNLLSEEMVRWMKNIFISLADSSICLSKSSSSDGFHSSSPSGHLSSSSFWLLSEPSSIFSWENSPQVDLQFDSNVIGKEDAFDPYRVDGKLSWTDIGNYGAAIEVSWMSVGKKQLEYAAGALRRFRPLVEQLTKVNLIHLNGNEKLAFWINLYNALMMHAFLAYGVPKSDSKLFSLMQKAAYTVGGNSFNAACIEYLILKMKAPVYRPQTTLLLALQKFKLSEEQRKFSIETPEPLAAFALSCGMYSSPAVRIYTADNVKEELQEAQRDFIRASVGVSSKGRLLIPKMLHCFARGFIDNANLVNWICHFLPQQQADFIELCTSQRQNGFLGSRSCTVLPFDSRFRYLFLPEILPGMLPSSLMPNSRLLAATDKL